MNKNYLTNSYSKWQLKNFNLSIVSLSFLLMFGLVSFQNLLSQDLGWVISSGGDEDNFGTSVTSDAIGNAYYCGYFKGDIDLNEAGGGSVLTAAAETDMFVSKLDVDGAFLWGRHFSSTGRNRAESITIDGNDNVYVTGYFEGTVDFDPGEGAGSAELTSVNDRDVFILKLDSNGDFIWVKHFGGTGASQGLDINFSKLDHLLVSGIFLGDFTYDPGGENIEINAASGLDGFAFRLDAGGNLIDYVQTKSSGNAYNYAIDEDSDGNLYIGGFYSGELDLDVTFTFTADGFDPYVIKYDATLNPEWVTSGTGSGVSRIRGLRVGDDNNIFFGGRYDGDLDFTADNGVFGVTNIDEEDIFLGSLNTLGEMNWLHGVGGTNSDFLFGLEVDNLSNVYATGYIRETVDFDPGAATSFELSSAGGRNAYIWKLNSTGGFENALLYDAQFGYDVHIARNWDLFIAGYYSGTIDFDPDPDAVTSMTSKGTGHDAYVSRFNGNCIAPDAPTLSETANNFCPNTSTTIDITEGNLNDGIDWVWYSDASFQDSVFAGTSFTTPNLTDTVTYYVRGEGACLVNTSEITINVGYHEVPVADIAVLEDIVEICEVTELNIPTATDNCGGNIEGMHDAVLPITETTTITWTYKDLGGNILIQEQKVILEGVDVSVSIDEITLIANNTSLGVFYRWLDCNDNFASITNATSQTFTPQKNGSYAVVILEDGCQDTSACIDVTTVGLEDITQLNYSVYPNPSVGEFVIELPSAESVSYLITDFSGRIVEEGIFEKPMNAVDLSGEGKGVYFLRVDSFVIKLVVQ